MHTSVLIQSRIRQSFFFLLLQIAYSFTIPIQSINATSPYLQENMRGELEKRKNQKRNKIYIGTLVGTSAILLCVFVYQKQKPSFTSSNKTEPKEIPTNGKDMAETFVPSTSYPSVSGEISQKKYLPKEISDYDSTLSDLSESHVIENNSDSSKDEIDYQKELLASESTVSPSLSPRATPNLPTSHVLPPHASSVYTPQEPESKVVPLTLKKILKLWYNGKLKKRLAPALFEGYKQDTTNNVQLPEDAAIKIIRYTPIEKLLKAFIKSYEEKKANTNTKKITFNYKDFEKFQPHIGTIFKYNQLPPNSNTQGAYNIHASVEQFLSVLLKLLKEGKYIKGFEKTTTN